MHQRLKKFLSIATAVAVVIAASNAQAQITFQRILSGLSSPVDVTYAPGDADRLFIVLQGGQIRIYDLTTNTLKPTPFITVPLVQSGGERGLLGLAFHPDYQTNGYFYVNFTDNSSGDTRVTRFTRTTDDIADASSALKLLEVHQPFSNHNAGWIGFGPDGYLYVTMGDGGSGGDPGNRAQTITNQLLGKMLRIDVDGDDFPSDPEKNYAIPADNPFVGATGDDEIFMYGLRNPWRSSFDRETGDLWIADVGQNAIEEITFRPADAPGGQNYGWRLREGTNGSQPNGGSIDPIYQYNQGGGANNGFSITGGYVYRGPILGLQGSYFFADYVIGRVRSIHFDGTTSEEDFDGSNFHSFVNWSTQTTYVGGGTINNPSSFGEDLEGNLYCCDLSGGEVFRLTDMESQAAASFTATQGTYVAGDASSLAVSDDSDLSVRRANADVQSQTRIEIEGVSPTVSPSMIQITLESSVFARTQVIQTIELFNFSTGGWEQVDSRDAARFIDATITVPVTSGSLQRFVDTGSNAIRARVTYTSTNPRQKFTCHNDFFQFWIAD